MKIFRLYELSAQDYNETFREIFLEKTIVQCGVARFAPETIAHENEEHVHEHEEVFVILTGEITVPIANGPSDIARAGDWALVESGEEHHLTNHTQLPCVAMFFILKNN